MQQWTAASVSFNILAAKPALPKAAAKTWELLPIPHHLLDKFLIFHNRLPRPHHLPYNDALDSFGSSRKRLTK